MSSDGLGGDCALLLRRARELGICCRSRLDEAISFEAQCLGFHICSFSCSLCSHKVGLRLGHRCASLNQGTLAPHCPDFGPFRSPFNGMQFRTLLKNMFGDQQMNSLADYIQAALMLSYNDREFG